MSCGKLQNKDCRFVKERNGLLMALLFKFLSQASFTCITSVVILSPWVFSAWEMWFFWPFVVLIFISLLFFSLKLVLSAWSDEPVSNRGKLKIVVVMSWLIFLAYAFARFAQADVYMDAERSFLLFLTPFLLGIQIVFGFDRNQSKILWKIMLVNLFSLGLYGVINHLGWKSSHVLWRPGYAQYVAESRATGTYFCPDHFSGIMELALSLALGVLLARGEDVRQKIFSLVIVLVSLVGIVLSKSRGGGLTIIFLGAVVLAIGFMQWPVIVRWYLRATIAGAAGLILIFFCNYESSYMVRFKEHFGWNQLRGKPTSEILVGAKSRLVASCRGQMYSAALRAWKDKPLFGIGPGMHQNLWPHYAPSPDGDRELGVWPSFPNYEFHSYEVHSDWIQLLEEYGTVGLVLFVLLFGIILCVLFKGMMGEVAARQDVDSMLTGNGHYAMILGAIFSCAVMAFHSFGDFNLQMPATVWLMAAIVAVPVGYIVNSESLRS